VEGGETGPVSLPFAPTGRLCLGDKKKGGRRGRGGDWTGARSVSAVNAERDGLKRRRHARRRRGRKSERLAPLRLPCTATCPLGDSPRRREALPAVARRRWTGVPVISSVTLSPHRVYVTGER